MFVIEILDQELTDDNSCNQSHLTERNTESVPVAPPVYSPAKMIFHKLNNHYKFIKLSSKKATNSN